MPTYKIAEDGDSFTLTPWQGPIPQVTGTATSDWPDTVIDVSDEDARQYQAAKDAMALLTAAMRERYETARDPLIAQYNAIEAREDVENEAEEKRLAAEREAREREIDAVQGPPEWRLPRYTRPGNAVVIHHASCVGDSAHYRVLRTPELREWLATQGPDTVKAHTCAQQWEPDLLRYAHEVYRTREAAKTFARLVILLGENGARLFAHQEPAWHRDVLDKAKALRNPRSRDVEFLDRMARSNVTSRGLSPEVLDAQQRIEDLLRELPLWNGALYQAVLRNEAVQPGTIDAVDAALAAVQVALAAQPQ